MKLIVGLGNIGIDFARNRHNLGFMVIDELAAHHDLRFSEKKAWKVQITEAEIKGEKLILAKPTTMMNLSGRAVAQIAQFYKIQPVDVWVVHDELDLPWGTLRVRPGGSSAGHNGVQSVIDQIGPDFYHWRLGIGRPTEHLQAADYVLQNFSEPEAKQLPNLIKAVADKIESELPYEPTTASYQLLT